MTDIKVKRCFICADIATSTCQHCGKLLCADCKLLENECLTYRLGKSKKKKGAK
jgi:hypothetical protein